MSKYVVEKTPIDDIPGEIYDALKEVGIPQNLKGYNYIAYGVSILAKDPTQDILMTADLYPTIAKVFDTTASRVERCIRQAIERAFAVCDVDRIYKYFGNSINIYSSKVSNSQFMYAMAVEVHKLLVHR